MSDERSWASAMSRECSGAGSEGSEHSSRSNKQQTCEHLTYTTKMWCRWICWSSNLNGVEHFSDKIFATLVDSPVTQPFRHLSLFH